jgi:hypothetical protein
MKVRFLIFVTGMVCLLTGARPAQALILINEFLADPAAGLSGDANGDGVTSSSADEFVELLNTGEMNVDLFGWMIADGLSTRHVFPTGSLLAPGEFLVVFGGGSPSLPGVLTQTASTGLLSLNNAGDQITLYNALGEISDQVLYGAEGGQDQSLTRFPDGPGSSFVLHTALEEANGKLFSPGTTVAGEPVWEGGTPTAAVPEFSTLAYLLLGGLGAVKKRLK